MSVKRLVPRSVKTAVWPVYRRVATAGWYRRLAHRPAPPDEMQAFWLAPTKEENRPEAYLTKHARSRVVVEMVSAVASPGGRVLEIGCSVGRNLEHLRRAGFDSLAGIEISPDAVELLRSEYPELAAIADVRVGPVEDLIAAYPDGAFDLVLTAGTLQHLPAPSEWVFAQIVRIARRAVVTIEDEVSIRRHVVPRNYRDVFEPLGMRQVLEHDLAATEGFKPGAVARAFARR